LLATQCFNVIVIRDYYARMSWTNLHKFIIVMNLTSHLNTRCPRLLQQKGTKKVQQCTLGNITQIAILGVANAAGQVIPPMVVFSGKNWNSVWNQYQ